MEPGKRERAFAWATAIGLQDVDGLKPSKYLLKTAKRHIEGEITAVEARRLVDEYYETKLDHDASADAKEADQDARIFPKHNGHNPEQSGQSRQEPITKTSEPITKPQEPITKPKWCPENDDAMSRHRRDMRERAKNIWERR